MHWHINYIVGDNAFGNLQKFFSSEIGNLEMGFTRVLVRSVFSKNRALGSHESKVSLSRFVSLSSLLLCSLYIVVA